MSPPTTTAHRKTGGFPRVSGDEPRLVEFLGGDLAFSPRERG